MRRIVLGKMIENTMCFIIDVQTIRISPDRLVQNPLKYWKMEQSRKLVSRLRD